MYKNKGTEFSCPYSLLDQVRNATDAEITYFTLFKGTTREGKFLKGYKQLKVETIILFLFCYLSFLKMP